MIDNRLDDEYETLRKTVEIFAREEVAPVIGDFYERHAFPYDLVAKMGEMGLFGLPFEARYGGQGGDFFAVCVVIEELARVDSSIAVTLEAGLTLGVMPIYRFGTEDQKNEWLPKLTSGKMIGAFGLTEPGAGSDASNTITTAVLQDDEWVINGSKAFITNAGSDITGLITVTAVTGTSPEGRKEISTIIVPAGTPGLTVAPGYSKVGWCAADCHELAFDNVRVPASNLLGELGRGYAQFLSTLDEGRVGVSALAVGLAQGCVDQSVRYAQERETFGQPLGKHQAIAFKIAEMEARTHVARLAYYAAAAKMLRGEPFKREASIAKLVSSNAAMDNSRDATQIFGGMGFINETPVARFYRDAKILEVGEGSSEVQKMLISRDLGL
ncbi:acyl-CoA dehydrogenase family protein [Kribbella sp. NPDC051587]|uniref:acyl-CoA dehydrogenase family protein n=1 Tax=Kribbella sp. NPDC051587 TaxID=3364119 RepID=UPI0037A65781